jgi:hypothetical protein
VISLPLERSISGAAFGVVGRYALIYAICLLLSVARTVVGGQDLNFDLVTYHYYLGYSAFADRLSLDYLPASFQGYQSPLPYTLLYRLDQAGVYPVVNASIHAAIHALNLVLLFVVSEILVQGVSIQRKWLVVACFGLLGAITPAYWYLVGTSFSDLFTSVPVLAGVWLAARSYGENGDRARAYCIVVAALLVGIAAGIRMHNAIYVFGFLTAMAVVAPRERRWRDIGSALTAACAGAALSFAPWAIRVYQEFGNPVFPFFNGIFRSPHFPDANLALTSFVPANVWEWIKFPFRMAMYRDWVYIETRLPDIRPALLAVLACIGLVLWLLNRAGIRSGLTALRGGLGHRVRYEDGARFIVTFFVASLGFWLVTSSNGRYGIALLLLAGPICGVLLLRILPLRYLLFVGFGVLLWHGAVLEVFFRQARPHAAPWSARYFDWNIPRQIASEPVTLVSFGFQTASTLTPHMHPKSSQINLVGQYVPNPGAPGADRIDQLLHQQGRRIIGVFDYEYTRQDVPGAASIKIYFRDHLQLWGLEFDPKPCALITLRGPDDSMVRLNTIAGIRRRGRSPQLIACELRPAAAQHRVRALEEFAAFRGRLASFGKHCPRFFGKPVTYLRTFDRWILSSFATLEVMLEIPDEGAMVLQMMRPPYVAQKVGEASQRQLTTAESDCSVWFDQLWSFAAETIDAQARAKP